MPAVQDILSTINQFAQARLPAMGSWRAMGFAGRADPVLIPEVSDPSESAYAHAGPEPLLDEILCDPVVQLVMQADRVQPADVRRLRRNAWRYRATTGDPGAICPQ
jgi:hypothetical protein